MTALSPHVNTMESETFNFFISRKSRRPRFGSIARDCRTV